MRKLLIVLITALLVVAVAFLPRAVAAMQDAGTMGEIHYAQAQPVQLEIREKIPSMGKLALMSRMYSILEIPDTKASMTREEVELAAMEALQPYVDAGLIEPYEVFSMDICCLLGQTSIDQELSGIFWTVFILCDEEGLSCMDLAIDDETGKLLMINIADNFYSLGMSRETALNLFGNLYFTALDIPDYNDYATDHLENQYIGENSEAVRYWFPETEYGEIFVDLYVHEYGFYTEFPG